MLSMLCVYLGVGAMSHEEQEAMLDTMKAASRSTAFEQASYLRWSLKGRLVRGLLGSGRDAMNDS